MATQKKDAGQAEAQKLADKAEETGYIGDKVDPYPNSAHSLESGPDSPGAADYAEIGREAATAGKDR